MPSLDHLNMRGTTPTTNGAGMATRSSTRMVIRFLHTRQSVPNTYPVERRFTRLHLHASVGTHTV